MAIQTIIAKTLTKWDQNAYDGFFGILLKNKTFSGEKKSWHARCY